MHYTLLKLQSKTCPTRSRRVIKLIQFFFFQISTDFTFTNQSRMILNSLGSFLGQLCLGYT